MHNLIVEFPATGCCVCQSHRVVEKGKKITKKTPRNKKLKKKNPTIQFRQEIFTKAYYTNKANIICSSGIAKTTEYRSLE